MPRRWAVAMPVETSFRDPLGHWLLGLQNHHLWEKSACQERPPQDGYESMILGPRKELAPWHIQVASGFQPVSRIGEAAELGGCERRLGASAAAGQGGKPGCAGDVMPACGFGFGDYGPVRLNSAGTHQQFHL